MADYVNLNYTAAEINADLAKVHGVDAVAPEAPSDGSKYVRKDGEWQVINPDAEIVEMIGSILAEKKITSEQVKILQNNFSESDYFQLKTDITNKICCQVTSVAGIMFNISVIFPDTTTNKILYRSSVIRASLGSTDINVTEYAFLDTNTAYTKTEIDSMIGNINTILDSINGEEV